jgi:hypothetical protein
VIWDNGAINGTIGTFNINSGPQVFDSFQVSNGSTTFLELTFGAWLQPGDVLQNVSFEVWTGPGRTGKMVFGASIAVTQSNCSTNSAGKAVCLETITLSGGRALPLGTLWLDIFHATSQNGDPVGWDINNGIGCTSPGCPSKAVDSAGFGVKSESFQILGDVGIHPTPEPGSLVLLGTGVMGLAAGAGRKLMRSLLGALAQARPKFALYLAKGSVGNDTSSWFRWFTDGVLCDCVFHLGRCGNDLGQRCTQRRDWQPRYWCHRALADMG